MFENRNQAGALLASALQKYAAEKPVVYALPRGGLPVAAAVADALNAPLDLILVRKLGAPGQQELAIGAVVDGAAHATFLQNDIVRALNVNERYIEKAEQSALQEIERRRGVYMKDRPPLDPAGRTAIIVDDGLATGASMEAAVKAMRKANAKRIVVAVPVAPSDTLDHFRKIADDVACLETPTPFWSVGSHYYDFSQLTDDDVVDILAAHHATDSTKSASEN